MNQEDSHPRASCLRPRLMHLLCGPQLFDQLMLDQLISNRVCQKMSLTSSIDATATQNITKEICVSGSSKPGAREYQRVDSVPVAC